MWPPTVLKISSIIIPEQMIETYKIKLNHSNLYYHILSQFTFESYEMRLVFTVTFYELKEVHNEIFIYTLFI